MITCLLTLSSYTMSAQPARDTSTKIQKEADFYPIQNMPVPEGISLEVGGMVMMPNDAMAVSTRHGEVWIIHNPYMKNGMPPRYHLFAQGMHEILGLNYIKGDLYLTQRSELTRLRDLDGDGEADEYHTVYSWPLAGNYHEYAYGPILDNEGNMVVTLNLGWIGFGESLSRWHGWMLKITPDGVMTPFASGFRSPAGFALNDKGDIFYAENQGDWVGSGNVTHVEKGDFVGNPASLIWSSLPGSPVKLKKGDIPDTGEPKFEVAKKVPGLKTPSVWFPHTILGISTSGILSYGKEGKMGPFEGQLFVGDQGQSKIMRVYLEKVKGIYQGAVFPFREGFSSGILRMCWGSDGSMFAGMTNRGWGSTGKAPFGVQRLEWNGLMPFEIQTIKVQPDGFELEFTKPVDAASARNAASYSVTSFSYKYHHTYGSPVINNTERAIKAISLSPDNRKVRLVTDSLITGYIHEIKAEGVRSANYFSLLHNFAYYTVNAIPDGDKLVITAENRVKPVSRVKHVMEMTNRTVPEKTAVNKKVTVAKHLTKQPAEWTNGPDQSLTISTKPGLKFDVEKITVKAGTKLKVTFFNNDDMLHNLVFTSPSSSDEVGVMAINLGLNGQRLNYIPASAKVLHHTLLLQPGQSDTIFITVPDKPGDYEYVCTYPGHYLIMKGVLNVVGP
ncbi:MAG: plastocyanin/azurin family copper-binding protein [Chitinophagaceae bacterium]